MPEGGLFLTAPAPDKLRGSQGGTASADPPTQYDFLELLDEACRGGCGTIFSATSLLESTSTRSLVPSPGSNGVFNSCTGRRAAEVA